MKRDQLAAYVVALAHVRLAKTPARLSMQTHSTNRYASLDGLATALEQSIPLSAIPELLLAREASSDISMLRTWVELLERESDVAWANQLLRARCVLASVKEEVPHYIRYVSMMNAEVAAMQRERRLRRVLFMGCGSFPLSAMILASIHEMSVTCLDRDPVACGRASALLRASGLANRVNVVCGHAEDFDFVARYQAIWVAMMVGRDEVSKMYVLNRLQRALHRRETVLAVRSPVGHGRLLYGGAVSDAAKRRALASADYVHGYMKTFVYSTP